jgi:hypothetical protein
LKSGIANGFFRKGDYSSRVSATAQTVVNGKIKEVSTTVQVIRNQAIRLLQQELLNRWVQNDADRVEELIQAKVDQIQTKLTKMKAAAAAAATPPPDNRTTCTSRFFAGVERVIIARTSKMEMELARNKCKNELSQTHINVSDYTFPLILCFSLSLFKQYSWF